MISHQYKSILVHIPKTGGTSIGNSLKMNKGGGRHMPSIFGKKSYLKYWDDYFKFSFVRNPWDRMVSLYFYYKLNDEPQNRYIKGIIKPTFKEFIISLGNKEEDWYNDFLISQKEWLSDEGGEIMVDYIGRFETYDKDAKYILNKLGVDVKIPHDRKGVRGDYKTYYDDETIKIVNDLFEDDIKFFNYKYK